ncbi:hypothetical protein CH375_05285 [Leptospira ellisii]|uniref:Uncharacterized protein n=1 Tax=Leptospira ellisii TaxID=2023197 RepID=A0A2N0BN40_9LEPT|nr:hypothetical protein CH379_12045 [Leptospira ellisii]PKA05416.1 hypothetical protein CH375_05285 [Leptospira ellisii]
MISFRIVFSDRAGIREPEVGAVREGFGEFLQYGNLPFADAAQAARKFRESSHTDKGSRFS